MEQFKRISRHVVVVPTSRFGFEFIYRKIDRILQTLAACVHGRPDANYQHFSGIIPVCFGRGGGIISPQLSGIPRSMKKEIVAELQKHIAPDYRGWVKFCMNNGEFTGRVNKEE